MGGNVTDWVVEVIQRPSRVEGEIVADVFVGITRAGAASGAPTTAKANH
jgi:hypothetical protein